jgi:hypothetical protein
MPVSLWTITDMRCMLAIHLQEHYSVGNFGFAAVSNSDGIGCACCMDRPPNVVLQGKCHKCHVRQWQCNSLVLTNTNTIN